MKNIHEIEVKLEGKEWQGALDKAFQKEVAKAKGIKGYTKMTSLNLGDKFDTSKVTDMEQCLEKQM